MNMYLKLSSSALCAGLFGALAAPAQAQADHYTLLDLGGSAEQATRATGLNDMGQVVGNNRNGAFITGADGTALRSLGTRPGYTATASGINDSGEVTGTLRLPSGVNHAFISTPGGANLRDLGNVNPNPQRSSFGFAINERGQVAGAYENINFESNRPFLTGRHGANMRAIGTLGGGITQEVGFGVNNRGQVVGGTIGEHNELWRSFITDANGQNLRPLFGAGVQSTAYDINERGEVVGAFGGFFDRRRAFLLGSNGVEIPITPPIGTAPGYSIATDVNNLGEVGGSYSSGTGGGTHAFITGANGTNSRDVNSLSFINAPGPRNYTFYNFADINDEGQFVVNATNGHAYLITAAPEPATVMLLLAGLGWMGVSARRVAGRRNG